MRTEPRGPDPDGDERQIRHSEHEPDPDHEVLALILPRTCLVLAVFRQSKPFSLLQSRVTSALVGNQQIDLTAGLAGD